MPTLKQSLRTTLFACRRSFFEYFFLILIFAGGFFLDDYQLAQTASQLIIISLIILLFIFFQIAKKFGVTKFAQRDHIHLLRTGIITLFFSVTIPMLLIQNNDNMISIAAVIASICYPLLISLSFLKQSRKQSIIHFLTLLAALIITLTNLSYFVLAISYFLGALLASSQQQPTSPSHSQRTRTLLN